MHLGTNEQKYKHNKQQPHKQKTGYVDRDSHWFMFASG